MKDFPELYSHIITMKDNMTNIDGMTVAELVYEMSKHKQNISDALYTINNLVNYNIITIEDFTKEELYSDELMDSLTEDDMTDMSTLEKYDDLLSKNEDLKK